MGAQAFDEHPGRRGWWWWGYVPLQQATPGLRAAQGRHTDSGADRQEYGRCVLVRGRSDVQVPLASGRLVLLVPGGLFWGHSAHGTHAHASYALTLTRAHTPTGAGAL